MEITMKSSRGKFYEQKTTGELPNVDRMLYFDIADYSFQPVKETEDSMPNSSKDEWGATTLPTIFRVETGILTCRYFPKGVLCERLFINGKLEFIDMKLDTVETANLMGTVYKYYEVVDPKSVELKYVSNNMTL